MRKIEILCFAGCPHIDLATARAREAVRITGVEAEIVSVPIEDAERASAARFLGSPSVRVDGVDVERAARGDSDAYGLRCRIYIEDGKTEGAPPVSWICAALVSRT